MRETKINYTEIFITYINNKKIKIIIPLFDNDGFIYDINYDVNYMHNKNDIRDYVKENYPNAKIYEIKYNYNLNERGKYADEAKEIPMNTHSAYDEE